MSSRGGRAGRQWQNTTRMPDHPPVFQPLFLELFEKLWQKHWILEQPWSRLERKGITEGFWETPDCGAAATGQRKEQYREDGNVCRSLPDPTCCWDCQKWGAERGWSGDKSKGKTAVVCMNSNKKNPVIKPPLTSSYILYNQNNPCFHFVCSWPNSFLLYGKRYFNLDNTHVMNLTWWKFNTWKLFYKKEVCLCGFPSTENWTQNEQLNA